MALTTAIMLVSPLLTSPSSLSSLDFVTCRWLPVADVIIFHSSVSISLVCALLHGQIRPKPAHAILKALIHRILQVVSHHLKLYMLKWVNVGNANGHLNTQ